MSAALEHANLNVHDIEEAVRFLTTALPDWKVRGTFREDGRLKWLHLGTDETYLALNPSDRQARGGGDSGHGAGLNHLGFVVDDAEALRLRLLEAGYRESYMAQPHPHRRRVYFRDHDGAEWEFVQYYSSDPHERNDYST